MSEIITIEQEHFDLKDAFRDAMSEAFERLENSDESSATIELISQTYTTYLYDDEKLWTFRFKIIKRD